MSSNKGKLRLLLASVVCGVLLTFTLTVLAFMGNSRAWGCTFVWQACLLQTLIHTPDNPAHEGPPIDLFAFALGAADRREAGARTERRKDSEGFEGCGQKVRTPTKSRADHGRHFGPSVRRAGKG